jgi:hypothetical protein
LPRHDFILLDPIDVHVVALEFVDESAVYHFNRPVLAEHAGRFRVGESLSLNEAVVAVSSIAAANR